MPMTTIAEGMAELLADLLGKKRLPEGDCVICGQKTQSTKGGQFVCGYSEKNSIDCGAVWTERQLRTTWRRDSDEYDTGEPPDEPRDYGYDNYRQEGYTDYKSYISSFDWQVKADALKRDAGYRCEQCGKKEPKNKLHVHHLHYKTLYRERRSDVTVLCADCHEKRHGKKAANRRRAGGR